MKLHKTCINNSNGNIKMETSLMLLDTNSQALKWKWCDMTIIAWNHKLTSCLWMEWDNKTYTIKLLKLQINGLVKGCSKDVHKSEIQSFLITQDDHETSKQ